MTVLLFSFGTLRQRDVQEALFGRAVPATADRIAGYRVGWVRITDPISIAASGSDTHPALIHTGDPSDVVEGVLLQLEDDELAAADRYEHASFQKIEVSTMRRAKAVAYEPKPGLEIFPGPMSAPIRDER